MALDATRVPRIYRFRVTVEGEAYANITLTQLLFDHEVPERVERVRSVVSDMTASDNITVEAYPA